METTSIARLIKEVATTKKNKNNNIYINNKNKNKIQKNTIIQDKKKQK